jgi:hypothetical protein
VEERTEGQNIHPRFSIGFALLQTGLYIHPLSNYEGEKKIVIENSY